MERRENCENQKIKLSSLDFELHELVSNKEMLARAVEIFFDRVIDRILLGIIFDTHRKYKTNTFDPISEEILPEVPEEEMGIDIFGPLNMKKIQPCLCPNPKCEKLVGALKFVTHLETCMSKGGRKLRNARRIANNVGSSKEPDNSCTYGTAISDDEYNSDWDDKRRKKKSKNGNKKKSSIKKNAVRSRRSLDN